MLNISFHCLICLFVVFQTNLIRHSQNCDITRLNTTGSVRVFGYTVYCRVFNFRYTVFLCLKLGIKYYAFLEFW